MQKCLDCFIRWYDTNVDAQNREEAISVALDKASNSIVVKDGASVCAEHLLYRLGLPSI